MVRKPRPVPIHDVRRLSIREVVDLWTQEIEIHPVTLQRELRRFLLNAGLNWREGERIDPDTRDDDLPDAETLVDQNWLANFCAKKSWQLPEFWFGPQGEEERGQGRPSLKDEILQEFERRMDAGETLDTISREANAISAAMRANGYEKGIQSKTIQKHIRGRYDVWKNRSNL